MGGGVDLFEHPDGDLGVDLGGGEFGMAEHGLDEPDVGPAFEHVLEDSTLRGRDPVNEPGRFNEGLATSVRQTSLPCSRQFPINSVVRDDVENHHYRNGDYRHDLSLAITSKNAG